MLKNCRKNGSYEHLGDQFFEDWELRPPGRMICPAGCYLSYSIGERVSLRLTVNGTTMPNPCIRTNEWSQVDPGKKLNLPRGMTLATRAGK